MRTLYKFLRAGVVSALFVHVGFAQKENVGIGTTKPDQSAILDLSSTNKGLLMPRVTLQQRNGIQNPANGLIVYQTDVLSGFYFYDGKEWKSVGAETAQKSVADEFNWGLTGNAGTNPAINFIGTTDGQPLKFRVNNTPFGQWDPAQNGSISIGHSAGGNQSIRNIAIGASALSVATAPQGGNVALGYESLKVTSSGISNMGIGAWSLFKNTTGNFNTAIGAGALYSTVTGSNNTVIGTDAMLFGGAASEGNIVIGYQAAYNESGSNKLYISNSSTPTPLVYGDFTAKYLAIGEVGTSERAAATSGGYRLLVKGGMLTEKIKVAVAGTSDWADYVFEPEYKARMMSLEAVEKFTLDNKHLPNVPSSKEMVEQGLDVAKTSKIFMEKIEELTLHIIELNKRIKELEKKN